MVALKITHDLVTLKYPKYPVYEIRLLEATDTELKDLSTLFGLALSLQEMREVKDYFVKKNRNPTDIELQALGQAWSEHCCYKSSKIPLKKHVFGIAEDRIIAREDAGVIEFDSNHYYCAALESHNHPSAIEPYGGAATGVGGIVRDIVCMGAQPIAYIDPLFFGPLTTPITNIPKGSKHPRYLFKGVVDGIRDYGNRIGIPTLAGQVYFHPGYTGNCLVNVGCIGIMKKTEFIHSRAKAPGNIYIYVGGKTGRDGIHGVTFASAELTETSEKSSRSAVQVGDPITKEPLIHATLECNKKGLLEGLKDFGGGGLSCVCGELAYAAGMGAEIHLDNIPLKEEGLSPWEIWVSESQERMMFLVKPENIERVLHICQQWDVIAVPIGKVIKEQLTRVYIDENKILEMDMDFLTGGPVYDHCQRPYHIPEKNTREFTPKPYKNPSIEKAITTMLQLPNIASKEWVIRQYDHEVRGNTILKPLQGKLGNETHGDATVIKPLLKSNKGLAVTADVNPRYMERNPYWGACSAVDEVYRNLIAVGSKPDSLLDCLNFGNPEKPERMGEFHEACRGLGDMARTLNLPFVSGNVSFYNESIQSAVPPTPEIVGIGLLNDIQKALSSDIKAEDNLLYLIGRKTQAEFGGSAFYQILNIDGGFVPKTEPTLTKQYGTAILTAIYKNLLLSCHDISEGGLAIALSEMLIGGDCGATIDIRQNQTSLTEHEFLFSETNTRWIVEVSRNQQKSLEKHLIQQKTPYMNLGVTSGDTLKISNSDSIIADVPVSDIYRHWHGTIWDIMG